MVGQNEERLKAVFKNGENERVEFKESIPSVNVLGKIINSMINSHGGEIYIGISPDGMIVGVQSSKCDIEVSPATNEVKIRGINSDDSDLKDEVKIRRVAIEEKEVLIISVVTVQPLGGSGWNEFRCGHPLDLCVDRSGHPVEQPDSP